MWPRRIHSRLYSDGIENGSNRNGVVEGDSKPKPFNVASCGPIRKERDRARRRCRSRNGMTRGFRPFPPARVRLKESPLPLLHRLHLLYPRSVLPALTLFPHHNRNRRASASGVDPFADLLLLRESRRRRRRGFHLFEPERRGLQLRNAFADEIVRPSCLQLPSLPPFPPAATKRLGSPSLLCPSSFPPFSASVFRLLAPRHQRPSPPPPPPFDCPRDKNRAWAPQSACTVRPSEFNALSS